MMFLNCGLDDVERNGSPPCALNIMSLLKVREENIILHYFLA